MVYNADNRRVGKDARRMANTTYYWDDLSDNVVLEEDENGDPIAQYVQEPTLYGELISQERDGQANYYHYDGRGDTRAVTDDGENIVETATYSAFGEVVKKTNSITNPFGFIGAAGYYANPETDDIYVRARTFQPVLARWLSADPMRLTDFSFQPYTYSHNSPMSLYDPSGLLCAGACCCCVNEVVIKDCGENTSAVRYGCEFTVEITMGWEMGVEEKECEPQWWEWATITDPPNPAKTWINKYNPRSRTFRPWTLWQRKKHPCPGDEDPVKILDIPGLPVRQALDYQIGVQDLYFAIKVMSGEECGCKHPFRVAYWHVQIETEKRNGVARGKRRTCGDKTCKSLSKLPTPPGYPPEGDWPEVPSQTDSPTTN